MSIKVKSYIKSGLENLLILFLLGFSILIVLQQANPMLTELGRDSGTFAYIGDQIRHGLVPYLDAWDSKPPGIFFVNALGLTLIKGSRWGIWAVEYLFLSFSSLLGFLALRKSFGLAPAITASLIWLYGLNGTLNGGNFTEEYSLVFSFLSIFFFIWSKDKKATFWFDFGIGLCAGSSFLFRLNNTGPQIAIVLTLGIIFLFKHEYMVLLKRMTTIGIASLVPTGALAIYLIPKNAMGAFWDASIVYNMAYSGNHFDLLGSLSSGLAYLGLSAGIALLGVIMAWVETGACMMKHKDIDPVVLWISASAIIEVILSALSGRNYIHYFINWLPLTAFASARVVSQSFPSIMEWLNKKTLLLPSMFSVLMLICFINVPVQFYNSVTPLLSHSEITVQSNLIEKYLTNKTTKDQTILVWGGGAGINFLTKRNSPTPYLPYPLYVQSKITDRISADFYNKLTANPPTYIVDDFANDSDHTLIPLNTSNPASWLTSASYICPPHILIETLDFIQKNYILNRVIINTEIYRLNR